MHDPITIAVILDEIGAEDLKFEMSGSRYDVQVDFGEGEQVGRTIVRKCEEGGVSIPTGLDVEEFWKVVEGCIVRAEKLLKVHDSSG